MDRLITLPRTLLRLAITYWRKLWVRTGLMGLLALAVIAFTQVIEPFIPDALATYVSGDAADRLLDLIANAMLAATIFSLTVMVSVFRSSASQWTPRIHRLIMQDPTTQNTLSTFIGAYVYALTGIVLRELHVFTDDQAFVLFATTVLVLILIVYSLVRWTLHLQTFGSLIASTRQVENITCQQFEERLSMPCLGAHALTEETEIPEDAVVIKSDQTGYIQHIYEEALDAAAERHGFHIYLTREIGSFVVEGQEIALVADQGDRDEDLEDDRDIAEVVGAHIVRGDVRTYNQDPRFGLMVLGEIASKALSPGINDPGTAIDVITRLTRLLIGYHDERNSEEAPQYKRLWVPPLSPVELIEDGFGSLARDGSAMIEVQQRLQKSLQALMDHPDERMSNAAFEAAQVEFERATEGMEFAPDKTRLRDVTDTRVIEAVERQDTAPSLVKE
ncbi:DUF2254 domain-containing protein [Aestuariibius insulae]|uniref:DUF2254 domain-containing protein n=1 Tax=Aestuariibius insulae TaxID=2058287 RepID=UPI00345ED7DB